MPLEIFPTTAEHIIAATDAVTTRENGCDASYVAQFMDVPLQNAKNALGMAIQLELVDYKQDNQYYPCKPYAFYLVTANESQKAAVLRLVLENFEPYRIFKQRLLITQLVTRSAEQVKLIFNLTPHRDEIKDTFISLGTFTQSLVTEGAGQFKVANYEYQQVGFLKVVADVASNRSIAEINIRKLLDDDVATWINQQEVLSPMITAYQRVGQGNDARSCIVNAGNALESFLSHLGIFMNVDLNGATGLNAKVDRFNNKLTTKHRNMLKYLGHLRNAADHGIDSETGKSWEISSESANQYVFVAISTIRSIVKFILHNELVI